MHLRKILMDGPIGRVFTDVEKTSAATAANLIAGTKPKVIKPTTTYTVYTIVPDIFVNLQTGIAGSNLAIAQTIYGTPQSGIITSFYFKTSDSNGGFVDLLFYNRVTKIYRAIINPDLTNKGSWNANRTYSSLALSFGSDECLTIRPTTRHVNSYVTLTVECYLGNLGS
jgi:hypothetical protein